MIGIISEEMNSNFLNKLGKKWVRLDENKDIDGLIIDWVPKLPECEDAWIGQASLLHSYVKTGIPIVIFDRYFYLNEKETNWVKKFNVKLFEPALNSGRVGFGYLPEWVDEFKIVTDYDDDREYDFVCSSVSNIDIPEFEKWGVGYAMAFQKKIAYSAVDKPVKLSDFKREEYKRKNLTEIDVGFEKGKTTMVIDSVESYKKGYLNRLYLYAMKSGCLPILPIQHKYFHGLFKGLVVKDLQELNFCISTFGKVRDAVIEEIFERIQKDWNEFTVDHAADVVGELFK